MREILLKLDSYNKDEFEKIICNLKAGDNAEFNVQNLDGNTLLHVLAQYFANCKIQVDYFTGRYTKYGERQEFNHETSWLPLRFFKITKIILERGGDLSIKNSSNRTPIEEFLYDIDRDNKGSKIARAYFFILVQHYFPKADIIKAFIHELQLGRRLWEINKEVAEFAKIDKSKFDKIEIKNSVDIVNVNQLPLECLDTMLHWNFAELSKYRYISDEFSLNELKQRLLTRIDFLKRGVGFDAALLNVTHTDEKTKKILFRAMLLDLPVLPLGALMAEMSNNYDILSSLADANYNIFKKFIEEYELRRSILEELNAEPKPLSIEEINLITPIYNTLSRFSLVSEALDKWYQRLDKPKRQPVLTEIKSNQQAITDRKYLGASGFWLQNQRWEPAKKIFREKCAQAAEQRISMIQSKKT